MSKRKVPDVRDVARKLESLRRSNGGEAKGIFKAYSRGIQNRILQFNPKLKALSK